MAAGHRFGHSSSLTSFPDLLLRNRARVGQPLEPVVAVGVTSRSRVCSGNGVGLAFDGTANLQIVDVCHGSLELHVRQGTVTADYAAACSGITSTLCTQACSCTGVANCCYFPGSANWCTGTKAGCDHDMMLHLCGDVEGDVATLATCRDALPQTTCTTQSNEQGALLPAACTALY